MRAEGESMSDNSLKIAVIGMAGRFPGAADLEAFRGNLQSGASGGRALSQADDGLVHYGFPLEGADMFDADFFDVPAREARMMDPQHRLFLECAYAALEHAGIAPCRSRRLTGVFGCCNFSGHALHFADSILQAKPLEFVEMLAGSDKDYLAARVAYKLNLKGPALVVQCACSSSLAVVATACQALLAGQCDVALAGGVGLRTGENGGYSYEPEGPFSRDGHVRAYSDDADGVNEGEGVSVVVLKRLDDALRDGETVYAVISGYAVGNDGADKTGFFAPSVSGQAAVIADALAMSGVDPLDIGYVEGHGTGTPIGDPMEVAALTQAWRLPEDAPKQYCRLGSVKTGLGHLNAAAGAAGLIKTVLALHHGFIPASLDFRAPNPRLNLAATPFRIADRTEVWEATEKGRKAAVNSLGIGGTNVHLILEEGPAAAAAEHSGPALVTLSARTRTALGQRVADLGAWLRERRASLADVAHTLLLGRDMHAFRLSFACADVASLAHMLESPALLRRVTHLDDPGRESPVAFLFPGFGSQYRDMARELRQAAPAFRDALDHICDLFRRETGIDVPAAIADADALADSQQGTCALFAVEYALARLLMALGVQPALVMGHSAGEYAAATVAGVFSEEDAVRLIAERSRLIGDSPEGRMLFVQMGREELAGRLPEGVAVGTVITPDGCVASGSVQGIAALHAALRAEGVPASEVAADRAGHSPLLESAKPHLRAALRGVTLHRPRIPVLSNVTGGALSDAQATDPEYWVSQMCATVRLSDEVDTLCGTEHVVMLEVGPSRKLSAMLRRHPALGERRPVIPVMPPGQGRIGEVAALLEALGQLWQGGGRADWEKVDALNGGGRAIALPAYPFERKRFQLERADKKAGSGMQPAETVRLSSLCWRQLCLPEQEEVRAAVGLLGERTADVGDALRRLGRTVTLFRTVEDLRSAEALPEVLVDCRFTDAGEDSLDAAAEACRRSAELCALLAESSGRRALSVYWPVSGAASFGADAPLLDRSVLLAPARILPFEAGNTLGCVVDVAPGLPARELAGILETLIAGRAAAVALTSLVAARCGVLWQEAPAPFAAEGDISGVPLLREGAAYLVLGGSGGIGRTYMADLAGLAAAQRRRITLVPVQRRARPDDFWDEFANDWTRVRPCVADMNDREAFLRAMDACLETYDEIGGIIHASGVAGGGLMQARPGGIQTAENWNAKVVPLIGMERILQRRHVDFAVLNTSIGALCGAVGQLDNTAANILLDTWALRQHGQTRVLGVRWDIWRQVGMINTLASLHERLSGETLRGGVTPKAAMLAWKQCLASGVQLPVASGRSCFDVLEEARVRRGLATDALESADIRKEGAVAPRPALAVAWRGPRHALDRALAGLFEERLGLRGIGIDDDYVELGGDSLMALPLARELRELLAIPDFSVAQIFRRRTVANIADALMSSPGERERLLALAGLLERVREMSPEEVAASLEDLP